MKIMNTFHSVLLIWMTQVSFSESISPRRDLSFTGLAKYDGYEAEQHYVTTKDGYILGLFRIRIKANCLGHRGTIMFMHGLYLSSDDCLVPGPGKAHCYIYSDNCYDVWAPNTRGNFYSRNHTKYNPDKHAKFWDFSIDEMAMVDLPALIDYVLKETDDTQLTYVGHSQGVALLLILCSKVPEYNNKIKVGFGLSTTAWLTNSKFFVVPIQNILGELSSLSGRVPGLEVFRRNGLLHNISKLLCGTSNNTYLFCSRILFEFFGYDKFQITSDVFPVVVGHVPSGTSLKNFVRWGQMVNNGFSEYDYGIIKNLLVYGRVKPPLYDLSKITMKWIIIASLNDNLGNITDVTKLVSNLPSASLCVLSDETFVHLDFIYGKDIPNYITPIVLSFLKTGSYECT